MEPGVILSYIGGVLVLFLFGRLLAAPLKIALKLVYNLSVGGLVLAVINFIGDYLHFYLPFNLFSSFIVGLLGIPGLIFMVVLKKLYGT